MQGNFKKTFTSVSLSILLKLCFDCVDQTNKQTKLWKIFIFSPKFYSKIELLVLWFISLFSHYVTGNYKPCSTFGTLPRNLPSHITRFIRYISIFHITTDNRFQCCYTFHHYTAKFPFLYFLIIFSQLSFKPSLTASRLLLRSPSKSF